MKKRNNKKLPKYWLGTRKPTSLGYQPNYGIGGTQFSSTPGEDINPEIKTVKSNMIPSALDKLQQHGTTAFNVLSNYSKPISNIGTTFTTAAANASKAAAGGVGARLLSSGVNAGADYMGSMGFVNGSNVLQPGSTVGNTAAAANGGKSAASGALGTAGTVLGAIGTLYGLGDMANQWANQNEHRSIGEMRNTQAVNTYTTDMGNTYTQRGGVNAGAELDYARATKIAKQLNFGATSIGTGLAAGATIGAIAGSEVPIVGTLIGGAAGALIGGAAAALGFGDTEEEVQKQMDLIKDVTALENRQNKTVADSSDVYQGFYNNRKQASVGKKPIWSSRGKTNASATGKVSNGETMIDFGKNGNIEAMSVVPGPVNKNTAFADGKKALVKKNTGILSNQIIPGTNITVSQYGLQTGDIAGAFTIQDIMNNNKYNRTNAKRGKLPKYSIGTPTQMILASIPHAGAIFSNWQYANQLKNADLSTPVEQINDLGAGNVAAQTEADQIDMYDYLKRSNQSFREANWDANRQPGLGYGGRLITKANLFRNMLNYQGDIQTKINEANRTQRNAGRELRFKNYLNMQNLMHDSWWKRENEALAKRGAYNNLMAQIPLNLYNIGSSWANNISGIAQAAQASEIQNEIARIYGYKTKAEKEAQQQQLNNLISWQKFIKDNPQLYLQLPS